MTERLHNLDAMNNPANGFGDRKSQLPNRNSAFSLTEMLVVIGIMVLLLAIAVPSFRFLTGSNSISGATNVVSAALARARADAVGLQELRGIAFFTDLSSGRIAVAVVQPDDAVPWQAGQNYLQYQVVKNGSGLYTAKRNHTSNAGNEPGNGASWGTEWSADVLAIDLVPDRDQLRLPTGINLRGAGNVPAIPYVAPAVVLFDENGQLTVREYVFSPDSDLALQLAPSGAINQQARSQIGLMLFEDEPFQNATQGFTEPSPTHTAWINQNATPLLVNRYNGTIVKGE